MEDDIKFLIIFFLTILIVRIIGIFMPAESSLYTDNIHHIYIGFILLAFLFLYRGISEKVSIVLYGISFGLVIDEIFLLFIVNFSEIASTQGLKAFYLSWYSFAAVIILSAIVVIKRKKILELIKNKKPPKI